MPESRIERRNSRALEAPLIADPKARAAAEARNGFRQYDAGIMPHSTRRRLARALAMLRNKHVEMPRRKHDNLPA